MDALTPKYRFDTVDHDSKLVAMICTDCGKELHRCVLDKNRKYNAYPRIVEIAKEHNSECGPIKAT